MRTARLLFDAELARGSVAPSVLDTPAVLRTVRVRDVPGAPRRFVQDVARRAGRLDYDRAVAAPLVAARRAVLGTAAAAPPRFLVRVDEFPHFHAWDDPARFGTERFARFHEILAAAGLPYLIAVLPRVSHAPLSPAETGARPLDDSEVEADGVAFGTHGLDHRTRHDSPRRRSELCGLDSGQTAELLDAGRRELRRDGIDPEVFVAPYNRFDAAQLPALAQRFRILCGGPESIRRIGFHGTPQWRGEIVYLPSYAPFYGHAAGVLAAAQRAIDAATGLWVPIVLHWGWEADAGWSDLERLAERLAPYAARWDDFRLAIDRSRAEPA
jgi:peptidoglycan/xylan/chitin deacetylase (PgdA/CDA1 family)